jgi:hypothetical protein
MVSGWHISRLERGLRRPRTSTVRRLADALALASPSLPPFIHERPKPEVRQSSFILMELIRAAGPALAPESAYRERIERRRDRKQRKIARTLQDEERLRDLALDEALEIAPMLAEQMFQQKVRRHEEAKRQAAIRAQKRKEGFAPKRPRKNGPIAGPGGVTLEQ